MVAYLAAALGGGLGALARWGVSEGLPRDPGGWPWATLLVNVLGCFLLGLLIARVLDRSPASPWLRPFLATGVLGGFTTWSAFAVETVQLADAGRSGAAASYVLASVAGGVLAAALGQLAGRGPAREPVP